jgi:peptide/nickel transport system substrate-binding protein
VLVAAACGGDNADDRVTSTTAAATTAGTSPGTTTATTAAAAATTTTAAADVCTPDKAGGSLTMGMGAEIARGLDPIVMLGTGVAGATENSAIYDTLMRYIPETGKFEPHVAESLTPNADFTQWTLKIPTGIKFGNGDPLTADAIQFSVDRLAKATVAASGMAQEVASMQVVDPQTITFTLKRPWGGFPYFMAAEGGMVVNPKVVAAQGQNFATNPLGAGVGPYEVERYAANEEIVLKAKTDYWGGPVCIQRLRFVWVPGGVATYDSYRAGELQAFFTLEAPTVRAAKADKVPFYSALNGGNGLLLNSGRGEAPVLADVRLRQAIAAAIDVKVINDRVYQGTGRPSSALTDAEQLIYPGVPGPAYDPNKAKQLVDAAKAEGYDGKVRLTCGNTPTATEQSITIEAQLKAVGFDVEVELLPPGQANQKILLEGNYDIGCGAASIFDEGPFRGMNQFLSDSVRNRVGYKNPQMDTAIASLYRANTIEQSKAAMGEIQRIWNDTVPSEMLYASEWLVGHKDNIHGLVFTRESTVMFHDAYVS